MRGFYCCLIAGAALAAPPPLRDQVSLNGEWPTGGRVPIYAGEFCDTKTYERTVEVPASWDDRWIKLEFDGVAFVADVYVDGSLVHRHVGAWNPFAVELGRRIRPGSRFTLRVEVKGPRHPPIVNAAGAPVWPVGGWFRRARCGITGDVWLRAYGVVHIEDAFIQTSFRKRELRVEYTVRNTDAVPRTVALEAEAVPETGRGSRKSLALSAIHLRPNEVRTVVVASPWADPELWWPDRPALYHLRTRLLENGREIDRETRRFGFREIWIEGNQFRFNGVRANLYGDYQVFGDKWYTDPVIHTPENWPGTVDKILAMNIRILRWHHNPVPRYLHEVTDEKGLLVCEEAANYARDYHKGTDQAEYIRNALRWIEPWIKAHRNHPSIYMWNATNEMTYPFAGSFPPEELKKLGEAIRLLDPTRPVGYDGDYLVDGELIDFHYPEGYNKEPIGSIYGWAHLVQDRPTGAGEMLHTKSPLPEVQYAVERNTWWLGVWLRGLRYTGWTNVKPACYWFAEKDGFRGLRAENLRNALAPVALFDKEYDDLGLTPYVDGLRPGGQPPPLFGGIVARRTLILYNDEFRGMDVRAEVELRLEGEVVARVARDYVVELGQRIEIPLRFAVPPLPGKTLEMILRTWKGGRKTFEEIRRFRIAGQRGQPGRVWAELENPQ